VRTKTHGGRTTPTDGRITARRIATCHGVATSQIVRAVRAALGDAPCSSLSVIVVDDAEIVRLHEQFMHDSTPTDVLTFDLRDDLVDGPIEAEIVLSAETAERQAGRFHTEPGQELLRYAIHGTLHLVGFDDRTPSEQRRMRREEDRILASVATNAPGTGKHKRPGGVKSRNPQRTVDRA